KVGAKANRKGCDDLADDPHRTARAPETAPRPEPCPSVFDEPVRPRRRVRLERKTFRPRRIPCTGMSELGRCFLVQPEHRALTATRTGHRGLLGVTTGHAQRSEERRGGKEAS